MVLKTLCPNQVPTSHPGTFFIASSSASRVARAALQSSLSRSAHKSGSMASSALRSSVMSRRQSFLLSTYHKWAKISYTTKPAIRGPPASQNLRYSWDPNRGLVRYLNGWKLSDYQMIRYSDHHLNSGIMVPGTQISMMGILIVDQNKSFINYLPRCTYNLL